MDSLPESREPGAAKAQRLGRLFPAGWGSHVAEVTRHLTNAGYRVAEVIGFGRNAGVRALLGASDSAMLSDTSHQRIHDGQLVIFGATGDLTSRMIVPSLLELSKKGLMSDDASIVGLGLEDKTEAAFKQDLRERVREFSELAKDDARWAKIGDTIHYQRYDPKDPAALKAVKARLDALDKEGEKKDRIFFLAIPASAVPGVLKALEDAGLLDEHATVRMEKPFGRDLNSAIELLSEVDRIASKTGAKMMPIDHYLAKTGVLKMAAFRCSDRSFEPIWNHHYIERIDVKALESIGVEERGAFYDETGALRDMLQGHLLETLSIALMHVPETLDHDAIRDSRAAALGAIAELTKREATENLVRGQYTAGLASGKEIPGYLETKGVAKGSNTETFAAIRLRSRDPVWAGVPFILSSGKALDERRAEVRVFFKKLGTEIAAKYGVPADAPATLTFPIEPSDRKITLSVAGKSVDVESSSTIKAYKSYERVLLETYEGDTTLSPRSDEIIAAWRVTTPFQEASAEMKPILYKAGTSGPWIAHQLRSKAP
jgi:glucose-6-phosphate 1-dehydrogenase